MAKLAMGEAVLVKLREIAGHGKFEVREYRVKSALGIEWRKKAKSTIRHLLKGEQSPSLVEAKQIEAAHFVHCAEKVKANNVQNQHLFEAMRLNLVAMQTTDPDFYEPHIEVARNILFSNSNVGRPQGGEV